MERNYIDNLTPIRGVAALLVVLYHANMVLQGALSGTFVTSIFTQLYLMVDLFFMISGFIMVHVYGNWFDKNISVRKFIEFTIARFSRIYPLHFFTLLFLIITVICYHQKIGDTPLLFKDTFNFHTLPQNIFLIQSMNTLDHLSWNLPSWSISVEWWTYMIFPFLIFFLSKFKNLYFAALCLILCAIGYLMISLFLYNLDPKVVAGVWSKNYKSIDVTHHYGFLRCILGFVIGMFTYQYFVVGKLKSILKHSYVFLLLVVMFFLAIHVALPNYITVWFFPLIILSAAYGGKRTTQLLNIGFFKKIGDWSYSIYLVHMPILHFFILFILFVPDNQYVLPSNDKPLIAWIICYAYISFTLVVSYFSYRFIELPARDAIRKAVRA